MSRAEGGNGAACASEEPAELEEKMSGSGWKGRIDLDALLVALVLVPHSYPRNRFFSLFRWTAASRVRRRASRLRSVLGDVCSEGVTDLALEAAEHGEMVLRYRLPELGGRRAVCLSEREAAIMKIAVQRQSVADRSAVQQLKELLGPIDARSVEATLTHLF